MIDVIQVYRRILAAFVGHRGIRLSREEVRAMICASAVQQALASADYRDKPRDGSKITCSYCSRDLTGLLEHVRCPMTGGLCVSMEEKMRRERE
jgi:hypothetical protein